MKVEKKLDINGEEFILYTPENDKDVERLREMVKEGSLDDRESFGDDPKAFQAGENDRRE